MTPEKYIIENNKRQAIRSSPYDPLIGLGCDECERFPFKLKGLPFADTLFLPVAMKDNELISKLMRYKTVRRFLIDQKIISDIAVASEIKPVVIALTKEFIAIRIKYDFPYWCAKFATIKDKDSSNDIKFILNLGQRKLIKIMFKQWLNDDPIRVIIVKSRQWGGSTLIQIFMMWIQIVHLGQWNSIICAHVENTARIIRGMYDKILTNYPMILDKKTMSLAPFQNSQKTKIVKNVGCKITIGSAEKPDAMRGDDAAMAHLSELGLWKTTKSKSPEDLVQSIHGGILDKPKTLIAYESTAKGVGNFFHSEWIRAKDRVSNYLPVFIAWFEHAKYEIPISDFGLFIESMSKEEEALFAKGATLEGLKWYRHERKNYADVWRFRSEFPSDDIEAFQSTGSRVFPIEDIYNLRKNCRLASIIGEVHAKGDKGAEALEELRIEPAANGRFKVWELPDLTQNVKDRYVVVIDVGKGLTKAADNSIITVFDRYWMLYAGVPEVVAEWCGHIDMDILAWKGAQVAKLYDNATLVIESNTLESNVVKGSNDEYILEEIIDYYENLYVRPQTGKIGFHTNSSSKKTVINELKSILRHGDQYIEREITACDEMDTYEIKENGSLGAVEGCRDDKVITRAIGIWICVKSLDPPKEITKQITNRFGRSIVNEASI